MKHTITVQAQRAEQTLSIGERCFFCFTAGMVISLFTLLAWEIIALAVLLHG